ncbi:MAG: VWA domain-containing protein [Phycisphaerae bacterium]
MAPTISKAFIAVAAIGISAVCLGLLLEPALAQEDQPSPSPSPAPTSSPAVERYIQYYLDLYAKHLKSPDWIARTMAVISLARIDDRRTTEMLMTVMVKDEMPIVRVYAWEALHARQDRLTAEQRKGWVKACFDLATRNALRGDLRLGWLGLMGAEGPTEKNKKLFIDLFNNTNSMDPCDIRTLWAMGDILKRWQSGEIIKGLIASMANINDAYRAELVLRRINDKIPHSSTLRAKGSVAMWVETQQKWVEWANAATFKEAEPGQGSAYSGASNLLPHGELIADPKDPKWQKDLELKKFRLDQLDVGFAIDSTGSMGQVILWIQRDVIKMMKAFELLSREPRIGVTLYRDKGDKYVTLNIPLTSDAKALANVLRFADAKGGGDVPEAVYEGLLDLVRKQKWSPGASARKVIVLIGDAPPHEDTMGKIEELVTSAAKDNFVFYPMKVKTYYAATCKLPDWDAQLASFDKIAKWGNGESIWVNFMEEAQTVTTVGTAEPRGEDAPDRVLFQQVLKASLEKGYLDRLDPLVNVLMEYVNEPVKERRMPFMPTVPVVTPTRGPGPGPGPATPAPTVKPRDPQQER